MALILWYRVVFSGPAPLPDGWLRLSNDMFAGDYVLDAEISVDMREGAAAPTFSIRFVNLPDYVGERIQEAHRRADRDRQLTAAVHLGYFEKFPVVFSRNAVIRGYVTSFRTRWEDDGTLSTDIGGQEIAAWKLLALKNVDFALGGEATPEDAVRDLLTRAGGLRSVGTIAAGSPQRNRIVRAPNGLSALGSLARWAGSRFVLRDGEVRFPPILPDLGPKLDVTDNIVSRDVAMEIAPRPAADAGANGASAARQVKTYRLKVLGEPALRAGQTVPMAARGDPLTLHVVSVRHTYGARGYLCDLVLDDSADGDAPRPGGAARVVDRFRELASSDARPGIDVGEVASYEAGSEGKHLATVWYGQRVDEETVAPSVETPVIRRDDQQLRQRPIASPFAWHRCGLVVPAYPGQRTLLSHNRGDVNDVVLHGYVWAEEPLMERPRNEPGDWWLCLPTEIQNDRPTGRAVNDLTDARGLRVIQARGLTITVGGDRLPDLGERPTPPDADTLTIEHARGTTIRIGSDGAVEIRTDGRAITLTDGNVRLALSGGAVEVS
ncbi:hypothetical protein [Conexibacter woesei]|uniref:Gp5/Type VI secretion system Vgr protein OB-fold domain-containing protein n=1 Tax=Conexibacter woesei (strain DSM 14684 / CCUG 47730 / CIP 108061 / JCM 11494 / NBRC 100937 / ID131577) TaxID=469383 RepID=D3FC77_CONWI|nr:hypothetical protein [Conexibacter woesei]ADB53372.1 hypothetical protein Cwoe_4961 [Conexibacter woesei DSM 14684]